MNAPSFQISMRGIEPNLATPPKGITSPCQSRITRFVPPGGIGGLKQETQSHSYNKSVRLFNSFMPIKSQIKLIDLNRQLYLCNTFVNLIDMVLKISLQVLLLQESTLCSTGRSLFEQGEMCHLGPKTLFQTHNHIYQFDC